MRNLIVVLLGFIASPFTMAINEKEEPSMTFSVVNECRVPAQKLVKKLKDKGYLISMQDFSHVSPGSNIRSFVKLRHDPEGKWTVAWKKVQDVFKECGANMQIRIPRDGEEWKVIQQEVDKRKLSGVKLQNIYLLESYIYLFFKDSKSQPD